MKIFLDLANKDNKIAKYEIIENESLCIINSNKNNEKDRKNKIIYFLK